jgi:hypothetical protein
MYWKEVKEHPLKVKIIHNIPHYLLPPIFVLLLIISNDVFHASISLPAGGYYYGKLKFPPDYPFKHPSIRCGNL